MLLDNSLCRVMISLLLLWAAISDLRRRVVPHVPGWGLIVLSIISLFVDQHWLLGLFLILAVLGSAGGYSYLLPAISGIFLVSQEAFYPQAIPFVLTVIFVIVIFRMKIFGGGDAQLAFALLGLAYVDLWWMPLALLFSSLIGIIPIFWKRGFLQGIRRAWYIAGHMSDIENDPDAVMFPWAVMAALVGLIYLWKDYFVEGSY